MAKPRLDRDDPALGTISPPFDGAFYYLHGHYFDAHGDYLRSDPGVKGDAGEAKAVAGNTAASSSPEAKKDPAAPVEVDLRAWAMKEANYPFFQVKKAVKDRFPDADTTNTATTVEALIAAGVVEASEAQR